MEDDRPYGVTQRRCGCAGAIQLSLVLAIASSAALAPVTALAEPEPHRREVFTGVEVSNNYATVYAGGGYALGAGFHAPGWRVRAVGAWGRYNYGGTLFDGGVSRPTDFDGEVSFLSAQAGYAFHRGRLIAKAFAGLEAVDQRITPFDPDNSVQGSALGLRLTLETWADLSDRWFLSADASYGTAFQEYWELTRIGYRLGEVFAVGIEGGVLGNQEYDAGRGGGFVRGKFKLLEATLSGGFTGDYLLNEPSGYVGFHLYRSF